ncbi:translation machinery-associated protein 20 [Glugoides intestinalis]
MQLTMSKCEKKKYNSVLGPVFDVKSEYKIYQISSKLRLFKENNQFCFFEYFDKIYPTVNNFDKSLFQVVVVDKGALGPVSRGADVMAPGILKYKEKSSCFKKDDVIGVEIPDIGIVAVGKCLMSFDEMVKIREGPVIEIYHTKEDAISKAIQ